MAIIKNGVRSFVGCVVEMYDRYYLDGMIEEYAIIWNIKIHKAEIMSVGYYGNDHYNLLGNIRAEVDISTTTARDIIRSTKKEAALTFAKSVQQKKKAIEKGIEAIVFRGRKVPKGTKLSVFWVGERPTYSGNGTEIIAGGYDENGLKIWIKAEYLENITPIKSPNAHERKKYIKWYVKNNVNRYVLDKAISSVN